MDTVVTLIVPKLITEPAIGSGCCVLPASALLERELNSVQGVRTVTVEAEDGTVRVTYDTAQADVPALCEALADVDYPVSEVRDGDSG
jgi:copper chaperone CopZ